MRSAAFALLVCLSAPLLAGDLEAEARQAIKDKRFETARAAYVRLLEQEPDNMDYMLWIARLSSWMKDYARALEISNQVLARDPQNTDALLAKAYVLMWRKDFTEAGRLLSRAQELAPANAEVQLALARYHHYQEQEKAAQQYVLRALALDPENQEAREMKSQIVLPKPIEVRLGYGRDQFSFAAPGSMGSLSVAYVGQSSRIALEFEAWERFGERVHRGGLEFSRRYGQWWLRGGSFWAPGALVLPRHDYTGGISRSLPGKVALGADYRFLHFASADAHVLSPTVEYYFEKPVWIEATFYRSFTEFRSRQRGNVGNQSFYVRYNQQVANPLVLHAGYGYGNESFANLSIDRLGRFQAHTYTAELDIKLSSTYSAGISYAYQRRSGRADLHSVGVSLTIHK